jgi:ABC-2 type transport system permease protein
VVVLSDVDFMTNEMAYQNTFFGSMVVGDNSSLLMNAVDDLGGSSDLISIRSRGNFRRPFDRVDQIEREAEEQTAAEVAKLNAEITGYNDELTKIASSANEGQQEVIGSTLVKKRREIELKIRTAQRQLNEVKLKRREKIEQLGNTLRQANMLAAPAVILGVAIVLGLRRTVRKRQYVSHSSDA